MKRSLVVFVVLVLGAGSLVTAQQAFQPAAVLSELPPTDPTAGFDNVKASWINFETHPIRMGYVSGDELVAVNQPGLRLVFFDAGSNAPTEEIPVGPGVTAVVERPGSPEIWVVDSVTHSVAVVDKSRRTIIRTIRLQGREPHGLVFHPEGDRAYVTCSASNTVEVLRTSDYSSVKSIDIPAKDPRGIAFLDGKAWVAAFTSGNNTTSLHPGQIGGFVNRVGKITDPSLNALPDRDLLAIVPGATPADDDLDPALTVTDVGSNLFNAHARPDSDELWIPNTEARNWEFTGEKNFPGGHVVFNRVTVYDVLTGAKKSVDLDQNTLGGETCAQPGGVAFSDDGLVAYVACYGTDVVAVLDGNTPENGWKSFFRVPGPGDAGEQGPTGPRNLHFDAASHKLFVFNKMDNSYSSIDVNTAAPGDATQGPVSLGFDPTPAAIQRGRFHFATAKNSGSGTSSCASCHPDGHMDGLIWELSKFLDPEGTAVDDLQFPMDRKGPMVTQSVRSLPDTGQYHWRGEQDDLTAFNDAFPNLLKRPDGKLTDEQFGELEDYVFSLVYRANPRQDEGRDYTGEIQEGFVLFDTVISVGGEFTCTDCHTLPTGTNGEIQNVGIGVLATMTQVTQLRALKDKLGAPHELDPDTEDGFLGPRTEQGLGTTHAALTGTIDDFVSGFFADPQEDQKVVDFMEALDTGLAPCTAWQATALPGAGQSFIDNELAYIEAQAGLGNCDIGVYAQWVNNQGAVQTLNLSWNHNGGNYWLPGLSTITGAALVSFVTANSGHATFVGLALGMGWRQGVDRDYDGLTDPFERQNGTSATNPDTDRDGFTDYHEVVNEGMNPLVPDEESTDDVDPVFGSEPIVVFVTTNTVKIEFTSNEPTRAVLSFDGDSVTGPHIGGVDIFHSMVLGGLPANTSVNLLVEIFDPAGNRDFRNVPVVTLARQITDFSATIHAMREVAHDPLLGTATVEVDVGDQLGNALDAVYSARAQIYYEDDVTGLVVVPPEFANLSFHLGCVVDGHTLVFDIADIPFGGDPATRKLHVSVTDVQHCAPATGPLPACIDVGIHCLVTQLEFEDSERPYIEGEDVLNFISFDVP